MIDRSLFGRVGRVVVSTAVNRSNPSSCCSTLLQARTMMRDGQSQVLAKDAPQTPYEAAILHLNSLQSNAITIQKAREKRGMLQEANIPKTIANLSQCGIELDDIDRLNVIHVSGTKGKGSTCAFVESILRKAGFRTGLYTSPHLVHARERIRINGFPISETLFAKHFFTVYNRLKKVCGIFLIHFRSVSHRSEKKYKTQPKKKIGTTNHTPYVIGLTVFMFFKVFQDEHTEGMPPYFKFLTLLSFHVFLRECVDVAIVEVGIGGEFDCTNVVQHPVVCGISTLDIDHTSLLGSTLPDIAWHKAGIIKSGSPTIASPAPSEALEVMVNRGLERGIELKLAPPYESYSFSAGCVSAGIAGDHQKINISLALQLARTWLKQMGREALVFPDTLENEWHPGEPFHVPPAVVEALESCRWRGRSQIVDAGRIRYYLDGAHTPKSMEMCSLWFDDAARKSPKVKRVLIFQCTADRKPSTLLPYLVKHSFDYALFCPTALKVSLDLKSDLTNINQSVKDQELRSQLCASTWKGTGTGEVLTFDCITSTVEWVQLLAATETLDVLVTGSLHLVGGVLSIVEPCED
ncbi:unnamed protein product [Nippostrongylus brasiliensis]|uniref:Folylpolyglutamate synthase n=1 Tax=Nippostrongylus brasiliensis TaxID=27835 RepID=A0A0N4YNJ5_NIPBR|nr:unnamed protein product [Nippostrongylus brasiliensis]